MTPTDTDAKSGHRLYEFAAMDPYGTFKECRGIAYDIAVAIRDGRHTTAGELLHAQRFYRRIASTAALVLGFNAVIGPLSPEQRAMIPGLCDEIAFPIYGPANRATLASKDRRDREATIEHGLQHITLWFEHHEQGPEQALGYLCSMTDSVERLLEPTKCTTLFTITLAMFAARRLRAVIEL